MTLLILLSAQLAVGAAAIFARYALEGTGPIMVSALRLSIASAPLAVYAYFKYRHKHVEFRHELLMISAGLALACHFATWIGSLLFTSITVSTLLVSTSPAWTALYDAVILKKRMPATFWWALAGGLCGVALITGNTRTAISVAGNTLTGNILATAGGAAFAAYLILIRFGAMLVLVSLSVILRLPQENPEIHDAL